MRKSGVYGHQCWHHRQDHGRIEIVNARACRDVSLKNARDIPTLEMDAP